MKIRELYKTAIVTGGGGFIGSHLVNRLLKEGLHVISVDDYSSGKPHNLRAAKTKYLSRFHEAYCDVSDYGKLKEVFKVFDVDIVFHNAASKKNICLKDPRRDLEVNGSGTYNVLELSKQTGVKKVVHASTGSIYGEAQYFPQDENHPVVPTSYYGVSKLAGEKYCKLYNSLYDLDTTVLRYFHVFGPNQEHDPDLGGGCSYIH